MTKTEVPTIDKGQNEVPSIDKGQSKAEELPIDKGQCMDILNDYFTNSEAEEICKHAKQNE